jgi:hypothetical protein
MSMTGGSVGWEDVYIIKLKRIFFMMNPKLSLYAFEVPYVMQIEFMA